MRQGNGYAESIMVSLVIAVLVGLAQPAAAGNGDRTVRATGTAAGTDAAASEEACADAQRKAVVEAAGVFVEVETIVQNYELVSDQILTRARGYLTEVRPAKQWVEGGISHCEILATVGADNLQRDLARALPHMIRRRSEPRCMIILTEDDDPTDARPAKINGGCAHRLENAFKKAGLQLIDKATIAKVLDRDTEAAALRGDVERLAARAQAFEAELLVYGQAEANSLGPMDIRGHKMFRWVMTLSAKIVRLDTAEIIVTDLYPTPGFTHTSMARRCGPDGFSKLADKVGRQLLGDLAKAWQQRSSHEVFQVFFEGCRPDAFRKTVHPVLGRLPGVRAYNGVLIRGTGTEITTEIHWAGSMNTLAKVIGAIEKDAIEFEELESSGNRIRFRIQGCE